MEQVLNKINDFSSFLLQNNVKEEQKIHINGFFINSPDFIKINFIRFIRPQDDTEDKIVQEKDENDVLKDVQKYSQISDFINLFGLNDTEDVRNKLNDFLNELLEIKNIL